MQAEFQYPTHTYATTKINDDLLTIAQECDDFIAKPSFGGEERTMHFVKSVCSLVLAASVFLGCQRASPLPRTDEPTKTVVPAAFEGQEAGNERAVAGIHDMHGNTCEWCRDWYHAKLPGGVDPDMHEAKEAAQRNRDGSVSRSRRGGTWTDDGWPNRSAFRQRFEPERCYDHIGFRVVAVKVVSHE